jgi:deoxyribose-phosphate aldolase
MTSLQPLFYKRLVADLHIPDLTDEQLAEELHWLARQADFVAGVLTNQHQIPLALQILRGTGVAVGTAAAFPLGGVPLVAMLVQIEEAVRAGATWVEVVLPREHLHTGEQTAARSEIEGLLALIRDLPHKPVLILDVETLSPEQTQAAATLVAVAGAALKTCTGVNRVTTPEQVEALRALPGPPLEIHAAGCQTAEEALSLLQVGAKRVTTSTPRMVLQGLEMLEKLVRGDIHLTHQALARYIDQTNLNPDASADEMADFFREVREWGFRTAAIMPAWVPLATEILAGSDSSIVSSVGYPLGSYSTASKVAETRWSIENGRADLEIDMVMNISLLKSGRHSDVEREIRAVMEAAAGHTFKVIIEAPLLSREEVITASQIAVQCGVDFIKTSTGFRAFKGMRPSTADDVHLIRRAIGDQVAIKIAGGVFRLEQALRAIEAGATRIGTIAGKPIVSAYKHYVNPTILAG